MAGIPGKGGQKGRSGRKSKADEDELNRLLDRNWPKAKRAAMIKAWSDRAERGDLEAGKLLMAYKFGRPKEMVEHRNPDGTPIMQPVADAILKIYGNPAK